MSLAAVTPTELSSPAFAPPELVRLFDRVATGYGRATLRFLPFAADRLLFRLRPRPGEKVLDVATGIGTVALGAARLVQPGGRVSGVDLSEGMLEQAEDETRRRGLTNADWHAMDGQHLEFRAGYFHAVACSAGLAYLGDPQAALADWFRVLRPGGRLLLTVFSSRAFEPMAGLLVDRLRALGAPRVHSAPPFPWHRVGEPGLCQRMLEAAGFADVASERLQVGYHLTQADDWWDIVWHSDLRGLLDELPAEAQASLRLDHLEEVAALASEDGIWMDVETWLVGGRKPAA